MGRGLVG